MKPESPCISICELDVSESYCVACHRTCSEIANWINLPDEQKQNVLQLVAERKLSAANAERNLS